VTMTKPRSVKFQHRANGVEKRRSSSSTAASESTSEQNSPTKEKTDGTITDLRAPEQSEYEKKKASFITRTIWTLAMIGGFFGALFAGHIYILMIITAIQVLCYKEVIAIAQVPTKRKNLPMTRSLNWYFLVVTMYFLYGESVIYYFKHILLVDRVFLPFATHHRFISFTMYIMGKSKQVSSLTQTNLNRICLLRWYAEERSISVPIHTIRLGTHGPLLDCFPGSFRHE
jgi:phosphatidate cytidylyltransferase